MMGLAWTAALRVVAGAERRHASRPENHSAGGRPTAMVVTDPAVSHAPIHRITVDLLLARGWRLRQEIVRAPTDLMSTLALCERLAEAALVVAIGGGTVLDHAKVASLAAGSQVLPTRLTAPQRSGLVAIPIDVFRTAPLIAIPTTLGTGSETSAVACLRYSAGKRLVTGLALVPDAAVIDPVATQGLPPALIAEGALEVLCRLVNPYVSTTEEMPAQDRLVEASVGHLVGLGYRVRELREQGRPIPPEIRTEIATLSGFSQSAWLGRFDQPFAVKAWLIANELSEYAGTRKMTAVAAVLPQVWRRILAGDGRLGSADRLHRLWQIMMAGAAAPLAADPATGIAELIDSWGVTREIIADAADVRCIARRTSRAWGAGMPMLGELRMLDLVQLIDAAVLPGWGRIGSHATDVRPGATALRAGR